jgi:CotH kinase protein
MSLTTVGVGAVLALAGPAFEAAPPAAAALPVISVDAERRIGRREVDARVRAPGFEGGAAIEVRGRWSRRFPKQSYAVELREPDGSNLNASLLGLPADDDWILYSAYNDRTLIRNVLAYATANRMGRYAARTRFVQLRLNGRYHGVYVLMEKLKLHDDRVRGDFLLEMTSPRQSRRKDPSFRTPLAGRPVVWEDPEREDLKRSRALAIRDRVVRAERALYRGRPGTWRRHLHAGAAADFLLVNELFKNQDAMEVSTYLTGAGRKLRFGPVWDFDFSSGNSKRAPSRFLHGWMASERPWAERLYADRAFRRHMARRWAQLRRAGLRAWLLRSVDEHGRVLAPAARRDSRRWRPAADRPAGTHATHVRKLRSWLDRRIAWMDGNL